MKTERSNEQQAYHVSAVSIITNVFLSIGKVGAGLLARSGAMVSDGIHSASDVISTIVVIIGLKLSNKDDDPNYEFGRERMECIAALILSMFLFITGLLVGWAGLEKIITGQTEEIAIPGMLALIAAAISIIVKEGMYWYTIKVAKKINSTSLKADAWHHRSDAFSSIGALVGIIGARMGFAIMDPIASLIICLFIGHAALEIFKDATDKLVDHSCSQQVEKEIREIIEDIDGVYRIDKLRTRLFGSRIYVETEIAADRNISFERSHEIAEDTHHRVEEVFPTVKHCMVHINPVAVN